MLKRLLLCGVIVLLGRVAFGQGAPSMSNYPASAAAGTAGGPAVYTGTNAIGSSNVFISPVGADPTGVADSTTAIQNAINTAATSGGLIRIPPGTFNISATGLVLPDNGNCANIVGAGIDVTILKATGAAAAVISKANATVPFSCFINDLTVNGNATAVLGIQLKSGKGWSMTNVKVVDATSDPIQLGQASGNNFYEETLIGIYTEFTTGAFAAGAQPNYGLDLLTTATDSKLISGVFKNAKVAGIHNGGGNNNFVGVHTYGFPYATYTPTYDFEDAGGTGTRWTNFEADGSQTASFHMMASGSVISGGSFYWTDSTTFPTAHLLSADAGISASVSNSSCTNLNAAASAFSWNGSTTPSAGASVLNITGCTGTFLYDYLDTSGRGLVVGNAVGGAGRMVVSSPSATSVPLIVRHASSPTTSIQEWNVNGGAALAKLNQNALFTAVNTVTLTADSSSITATTAGTATNIFLFSSLIASSTYSFHCAVKYVQSTGNAAVGVAIQGNTNAPTNLSATATVYTSATAFGAGDSGNISSTTSTQVAAPTGAAFGTVLPITIDGSIETGGTVGSLNVNFFTGNASDGIVIKRGSYCSITP